MPPMSEEHKQALAKGRAQARSVKRYLEYLKRGRKRGPKVTRETLTARLEATRSEIEQADDPIRRVELIQRRMDDEVRLEAMADEVDVDALEAGFVEAAAEYSERKGITWPAWRELGVPADLLRKAGVKRTRRT